MTALDLGMMTIQMPIVLRMATKADLPKLEWYGQYAHFRNLFRRSFREQQLGRRAILIADSNNFPVGHIFIQLESQNSFIGDGEKRAYLYSFRVMEMFRRRGIGTRLIRGAESIAMGRGLDRAAIAVAKENIPARRLYERLGYKVFGEDPGKWSYMDHRGKIRQVEEPCWLLDKKL